MRNLKARVVLLGSLICLLLCSSCTERNAHEVPVSDGQIVVLRKGASLGAFALLDQRMPPKEMMNFVWFFRSDGKQTLASSDPGISRGTMRDQTMIVFGDFKVEWSANTSGKGWIYYGDGDFEMAVTEERQIEKIDASTLKFKTRR